jgi:PAS domain-containing protein
MISESNLNLTISDSLESLQKRLHLISKTAKIGDWSHIFKTNLTSWSDYLYEFYELDKTFDCSSLLESTQFYQRLEKEKMRALLAQATLTQTQCSAEFMIVMNDGRIKWHTTTVYPVLDGHGDMTGLYGILQNISATKEAEENKKKENILYNHILDRLPTELVVLNKEGRYIYANDAAIKSKERRGIMLGSGPDQYSDLGNWIPAAESRRHEVINECMVQTGNL